MNEQAIGRESPLAHLNLRARAAQAPAHAGVTLGERPYLGHLNLRGDPADRELMKAVQGVLGFRLPLEANTFTDKGADEEELAALWLGPDEWLILTPTDRQAATADALRSAAGTRFCAVTDVSGGQTIITLAGAAARDVLAKGCTLDFHPWVFGPGHCAQTHIARAGATIRQTDESPSFEIIVRRSFADYLWPWLEDAVQEYGMAVGDPRRRPENRKE